MATILNLVGWVFSIRPVTFILGKMIRNVKVRGFVFEIFYLILASAYFGLIIFGITNINEGIGIGMLIVGAFATMALSYSIYNYHKSDSKGSMSQTEHDGYSATYNSTSNEVYVKEKEKETLSADGWMALLTSPLTIAIRFFNFCFSFITLGKNDYICDLAIGYHPETKSYMGSFFIDIVKKSDYR